MKKRSEFNKFETALKTVLAVSHEELKRREEKWKKDRKNATKKRASALPASRAADDWA